MLLKLYRPSAVYHAGSLVKPASRRQSYEGSALSVSLCPDAWSRIARLGGPIHEFTKPGMAFLSFYDLDEDVIAHITAWAVAEGLLETAVAWRAWSWDDEFETWRYMVCPTEAAARAELPDDEADVGNLPDGAVSLVEPMPINRLTPVGVTRADGYGGDCDATDIAAQFWIEDILRTEIPPVVGLWWEERFDPDALSAPRGAIVPSAIQELAVKVVGCSPFETDDGIDPEGMGPLELVDYDQPRISL